MAASSCLDADGAITLMQEAKFLLQESGETILLLSVFGCRCIQALMLVHKFDGFMMVLSCFIILLMLTLSHLSGLLAFAVSRYPPVHVDCTATQLLHAATTEKGLQMLIGINE